MVKEINVSIILPARTYLEDKVASVILPAVRADVDIFRFHPLPYDHQRDQCSRKQRNYKT